MRRLLLIIAGLAVVATASVSVLMIMFFKKSEDEKKRSQTAAARAKRWPEKISNEKNIKEVYDLDRSIGDTDLAAAGSDNISEDSAAGSEHVEYISNQG